MTYRSIHKANECYQLFVMWTLIAERLFFFGTEHRRNLARAIASWEARPERRSWKAHRIREAMISRFRLAANESVPMTSLKKPFH